MKNKKLIILILALVAVLGASVLLYPLLKDAYEPKALIPTSAPTAVPTSAPTTEVSAPAGSSEATSTPSTAATEVPTEEAPPILPDFNVLDYEGNSVSLSDYFGKPIILNFWATWCGPCKAEMPDFDNAFKQYGEDITFLMVNLTDGRRDTVDGVKAFIQDSGYSFPVYFDTEYSASYAYGVQSIPMTLFINPDGTLMNYQIGTISEKILLAHIAEMTRDK